MALLFPQDFTIDDADKIADSFEASRCELEMNLVTSDSKEYFAKSQKELDDAPQSMEEVSKIWPKNLETLKSRFQFPYFTIMSQNLARSYRNINFKFNIKMSDK